MRGLGRPVDALHMKFVVVWLPEMVQNWTIADVYSNLSFRASKGGLRCNIELVLNALQDLGLDSSSQGFES